MKTCTKCKIEQPKLNFSKNCRTKDRLRNQCKTCDQKNNKNYCLQNQDKINLYLRTNKLQIKIKKKKYREKHKEKAKLTNLKYRQENPELVKLQKQKADKKYYAKNKPKILKTVKAYSTKNKTRINNYQNQYRKDRLKRDALFNCKSKIQQQLRQALKNRGFTKKTKTSKILGADFEFIQQYLIMTAIGNYGFYDPNFTYHIDHIIPCSSAKTEDILLSLFYYTNLQFLTPKDNLEKSDKLNWKDLNILPFKKD
jgi:hypothetical protein